MFLSLILKDFEPKDTMLLLIILDVILCVVQGGEEYLS